MTWKYFDSKFVYEEVFNDLALPWAGHKYFAYDLIRNVKPKVVVELGTFKGTSLFSFCQAVKDEKLDTKLFAVDTWQGDEHAGFYGDGVFEGVKSIIGKYYSSVSVELLRKKFDEALNEFKDASIDVLHIDGLHTYEAVKHDFETWFPKVKDGGIILFHDISVVKDDFGVYKLWHELKDDFKTIEFLHSYGLGVLIKGTQNEDISLTSEELQLQYACRLEDIENKNIAMMLDKINLAMLDIEKKNEELRNMHDTLDSIKKSRAYRIYSCIKRFFKA